MNNPQVSPQEQQQLLEVQQRMQIERRFLNGVNWFAWIALLSIINTVVFLINLNFVLIFGLGATQIVDAIVAELAKGAPTSAAIFRIAGIAINLGIAGVFVLFWRLGEARNRAAIITGMVLYLLDGILVILFQDYIGGAFHAWALYGMFSGLRALGQLEAKAKMPGSEVIQTLD